VPRDNAIVAAKAKSTPVKSPFSGWDGSIAGARELQAKLARRVRAVDRLSPVRLIAGVDVGFEEGGRTIRGAAVLVDARTLQPLARALVRMPTRMPYVPGLLSFRELPALLGALGKLPCKPDLVMVDGHGLAHPRAFGIASHFGVVSGLPTIGVAKSILIGEHDRLGIRRGSRTPLLHHDREIGTVLRSKRGVRPLIVSVGHKVSLPTAVELVLAATTRYRLPEPVRHADRLASRRDIAIAGRPRVTSGSARYR